VCDRGQDNAGRRKIWLPQAAALITIIFRSTRPAIHSGVSGVTGRGDRVALLRGCAFDGLGGDGNSLGRLDFVHIRGESVPRAALMTSMRLVGVLGFPNATEAVGGRLIRKTRTWEATEKCPK